MIYHAIYPDRGNPPYGTFDDLQDAVDKAVNVLVSRTSWFDVIAVQGTSGMSIGFPTFLALKALVGWTGRIVVVRKPGEDSHGTVVEGMPGSPEEKLYGKRCLFLDDFVSEGETRKRVREEVERAGGKLVAQYLSRTDSYEVL